MHESRSSGHTAHREEGDVGVSRRTLLSNMLKLEDEQDINSARLLHKGSHPLQGEFNSVRRHGHSRIDSQQLKAASRHHVAAPESGSNGEQDGVDDESEDELNGIAPSANLQVSCVLVS